MCKRHAGKKQELMVSIFQRSTRHSHLRLSGAWGEEQKEGGVEKFLRETSGRDAAEPLIELR